MADFCDALRAKFGPLRPTPAAPEPLRPTPQPAPGKRRKRMTLRLSTETAAGLRILRIALGRDMNGLCEEVLSKAVGKGWRNPRPTPIPVSGMSSSAARPAPAGLPGATAAATSGTQTSRIQPPSGRGEAAMASSKSAARGGSMVRTGGKAEGSGTSRLAAVAEDGEGSGRAGLVRFLAQEHPEVGLRIVERAQEHFS